MKIYPAIDLVGGRCVRLQQGRFETAKVYGDDPLAMADRFERAGASVLHVVDLDGAKDPKARQLALLKSLAGHTKLSMEVGGGIRDRDDVAALLEAGVARVVVGSVAAREPDRACALLSEFGPERVVLGLDVRLDASGVPRLATHGWKDTEATTLWSALECFVPAGMRWLLCTDIGRDGMLTGPSADLYRQVRERFPAVELLASGGIATLDDLKAMRALGCAGAIVGKALYEGRFTLEEALAC
ncbi:MAG TPA: 1-(5-phosphoribosyl)-5-[(5-phosphoribosylamino)methylideneamino]imidazole-4-carboxamide isomerase [Thermoleophilia bacterium]|nr:1-(5-phosphoribosyl)-5-[(5-phosphoribosylamino)methylideneamino]imidazole-4-carboxamide isomerase [Thermoleophilia bacterium]